MKRIILVLVILLLPAILYSNSTPTAHAANSAVGTVCLADPGFRNSTTTGLCPSKPQAFTAPVSGPVTTGNQLRVSVNLNNSVAINGFDIIVLADHNVLRPYDADLAGGILPSNAQVILKCVGRAAIVNVCSPQDTLDTIHLSVTAPNFLSNNPTTGLLFTAVYSIVGNATGMINLGFQTGCGSNTSVSGGLCIIIESGGSAVPETAQAATYSTTPDTPFFTLLANPNSFQFPAGTTNSRKAAIALVETFGFSCGGLNCVDLTTTVPAVNGLSASLTNSSFTDSGTGTLSLSTTSSTPPGVYVLSITGKPDLTNTPLTGTTYLGSVVTVTVTVASPPDFSILATPQTVLIQSGTSVFSNITLTSLNQFSGSGTFGVNITLVCCPGAPPPTTTISPSTFTLSPSGMFSASLMISASSTPPPGGSANWLVIVSAASGSITHSATVTVQIRGPADVPPIASFTFSPATLIVGQQAVFDASGSHDPDGFITTYQWNFGDGFVGFGEIFGHAFASPGTFTVVLTVTDNVGLSGSVSRPVIVLSQPADDVSVVNINVNPTTIVSTEIANVQVTIRNDGLRNETVSVSAFFGSHLIGTATGVFVQAGNCGFFNCQNPAFVNIAWDTTGVAAGNYTISATVVLANDPTPADNTLIDGIVTVLPPPVLTLTPPSGPVGTLVTIHGSGFPGNSQRPPFFSPVEIQVTFDDQLVGFFFLSSDSFNFSFDVPVSQAGTVHHVHALEIFPFNLNVHADFRVTPALGSLTVSVNTGAVYFPGDTAVIYVLASQGGALVGPTNVQVQITLVLPNGTSVAIVAKSVSPGLFTATYAVPTKGSLGTYGLVVKVHSLSGDGSSLSGFEVKPTWLNQHSSTIMGATAVAGVIGLVAVAWQKGYLGRRRGQASSLPF